VTLLLDRRACIDSQNERGLTPLMVAIDFERDENCKTLLARGANVRLRNLEGDTPLHLVCRRDDTTIAKLLLKNGADIEAIDSHGRTSLSCAASLGNEEIVKFLLRNGANTESRLVDGMTCLHCACNSGKEAVVRSLIHYGADVDTADDCGRTSLWHATRFDHLGIVKILLKATTSNINAQVYNGPTALSTAVLHNYNATVKVLLEAGAEIFPQDPGPHVTFLEPEKRLKDYGMDAIVEAVTEDHQHVCRTVLEAGAKSDPGDYARWLLVWNSGEHKDLRPLLAWVNVRKERLNTPKIRALRIAMIKKVRELGEGKRRKVAKEIGVPFVDPNFAQRDAELNINLEDDSEDSEHESDLESGEE